MIRTETRRVKVGNLIIGGNDKVIIQSMCNIKTSNYQEVIKQIHELEKYGCELIRVSIMDKLDAEAIKFIKKEINIPLVGDIHFDYKLALLAMDNGIDKIRINPGNIGSKENVNKIIKKAKETKTAIRIGVNSGSLDSETLEKYHNQVTPEGIVELCEKYIKYFEEQEFYDLVISLKSSSILTTIASYRLISQRVNYPLHLGITEAGNKETGLIRSSAGLSPLLLQGIGDTIRISLSSSPIDEVIACKMLLHDLNLYPNYPTLISCPTCGRTQVDIIGLVNQVNEYLKKVNKNITIAIMGCIVNGPGEAKHADIGLAGGRDVFALFKQGKVIKTINQKDALNELINYIENEL